MAKFQGKFTSAKQEWETPLDLFQRLDTEFQFQVDLAADATNTKCSKYIDQSTNALLVPWTGVCWLNPPYGGNSHNSLQNWVKKAWEETSLNENLVVVMLIPARTNTKWWHHYCMKSREVRFIEGRPKFGDATHGLPQPLALVVFGSSTCPTQFNSFKL